VVKWYGGAVVLCRQEVRLGRLAVEFTDLVVYQEAMLLAQRVFDLTKEFPRGEAYLLSGQLRRSSRSIGAQIAEA
jgi:hypothetical protein